MTKKRIVAGILAALTLAWIGFIFSNSLRNGEKSGGQSGFVVRTVQKLFDGLGIGIPVSEYVIRKLAHFTEYAILGGLLFTVYFVAFRFQGQVVFMILAGILIAVVDEHLQLLSAGRVCSVIDMCIDSSGVVLGGIVVLLIAFLGKRKYRMSK